MTRGYINIHPVKLCHIWTCPAGLPSIVCLMHSPFSLSMFTHPSLSSPEHGYTRSLTVPHRMIYIYMTTHTYVYIYIYIYIYHQIIIELKLMNIIDSTLHTPILGYFQNCITKRKRSLRCPQRPFTRSHVKDSTSQCHFHQDYGPTNEALNKICSDWWFHPL